MFGFEWLYKLIVNKDSRVKVVYEEYVNNNIEFHKNNRFQSYKFLFQLKHYYAKQNGEIPVAPVFHDSQMKDGISDIELIRNSGYFDADWYAAHYPDVVGKDPAYHYLMDGWTEYRSPGPSFSTLLYLNRYDDVREMKMNPLLHYEKFGKREKRVSSYQKLYESIKREIELIEKSIFWDGDWYEKKYLSEQYHIEKPAVHYYCLGCYLQMDPGPAFSQQYYETFYPDVLEKPYPHLLHFEQIGKNTGRGYFNRSTKYYENKNTRTQIMKDMNSAMFDIIANHDKKKVLLVSHLMNLTGAPKVLVKMAIILKNNNFFPVVATFKHGALEEELKKNDIPVVLLVEYEDKVLSEQMIQFANIFDVILFNTVESLRIAHILGGTNPYKIGWFHEGNMTLNHVEDRQIGRLTYLNRIFTCAEYCNKFFEPYLQDSEIEIMHYGINEDEVKQLQNVINVVSDKFIVIIIGTVGYRKGHDILVDSLQYIPDSIYNEMEFWVVGFVIDSKVGEQLDKACIENQNIKYYGEVSNDMAIQLISESSLLIVPSRDDPMPVVITEAMILKKPVLMSKTVGTSALVEDGVNAYILEENNAVGLAAKLADLYKHRDELNDIGETGYEVYRRYLSDESFEKRILEIFSETEKNENIEKNIDNKVYLTDMEMLSDGIRILLTCSVDNKLKIFSEGLFFEEENVLKEPRWNTLNKHLNLDGRRIAMIKIPINTLVGFSGVIISDYFDGIRVFYGDYVWSNLQWISDKYNLCVMLRDNLISFTDKKSFEQFVEKSPMVKKEIKGLLKVIKGINEKPYSLYVETRENKNDNAYQLFRYDLMTNKNAYFVTTQSVLESETDEYLREHYLILNTNKMKQYMLRAKMVVCSWYALPIYGFEKMSYLYPFLGLNYVFVPHGISFDKDSYYLNKSIWGHFSSCIVSSKYEQAYFSVVNGYSNVQVLGYPRLDKWAQSKICDRQILLFPTWREIISHEYISELLKIVKVIENYSLIYIAHPSIENQDYLKICNLLKRANENIICVHSKESEMFNQYFSSAKYLITDYSSVAYDFAYKGGIAIYYKPFMELDPNYDLLPEFYEHNCGVIVNDETELRSAIEDKSIADYVGLKTKDFFGFGDDNNTRRVFEFINET